MLLHLCYSSVALLMGIWTLYLDLRYYYGWQGGAFCGKFTHVSFLCTLTFLLVSVGDAATMGLVLAAARRWMFYVTLVLALAVDVGFFVAVFPRRLMGKDKNYVGSPLSPTSAHKHLINLLWLLGEVGTHDGFPIKAGEVVVFAVIVPFVISAGYYRFAKTIKDEEKGTKLLNYLGIPLPEEDAEPELDATKRGNMTAIPGHWIYGSFKHKKLRTAFLLSPLIYAPLGLGLIALSRRIMAHNIPVQVIVLIFTAILTPSLYGPDIWKRRSLGKVFANMVQDMTLVGDRLAHNLEDRLLELKERDLGTQMKDLVALWKLSAKNVLIASKQTFQMMRADLKEAFEEFRTKLKNRKRSSSKRRSNSSKRQSSKRTSLKTKTDCAYDNQYENTATIPPMEDPVDIGRPLSSLSVTSQ